EALQDLEVWYPIGAVARGSIRELEHRAKVAPEEATELCRAEQVALGVNEQAASGLKSSALRIVQPKVIQRSERWHVLVSTRSRVVSPSHASLRKLSR